MSVLEELFNGNLRPIEQCIPGDEYQNLKSQLFNYTDKLYEHLSEQDRLLYEQIEAVISNLGHLTEQARFISGFSLGATLVWELFGKQKPPLD